MKTYKIFIFSILILLFCIININLIAQTPLEQKGAWGVNAGFNLFYPSLHDYSVPSGDPNVFSDYNVKPSVHLGYFFGISRIFRICKIEDKNPIDISIGLSYNQRSAILKYKAWDFLNHNYINGKELLKASYPSIDIKLSNILNFKEKYGISNSIGFRTNFPGSFYDLNLYNGVDYQEYYLTYSLGFIFYLKKINLMPVVNTTIFDLRKVSKLNPYNNYSFSFVDKDFFQLINFGVCVSFNNSFKKDKDEKK